ncbi:hypothetical protein PRIPAC_88173, partial [Pristionchus pacificus]
MVRDEAEVKIEEGEGEERKVNAESRKKERREEGRKKFITQFKMSGSKNRKYGEREDDGIEKRRGREGKEMENRMGEGTTKWMDESIVRE